ncbi:MAG TPA: type II toxin-antitoxin system HipA family toxin [Gammaproteobacteria bacterium]|nr:type II toxin-antitoxin system HipA family toxin [Gammaproteobacteria bacterium]
MSRNECFLLQFMDPWGAVSVIGKLEIRIGQGERIEQVWFSYTPNSERLDPRHSLGQNELIFDSDGRALPGFVDDYLPDSWGKKVIGFRLKKSFPSLIELLQQAGVHATLGAIKVVSLDKVSDLVPWDFGPDIDSIFTIPDQVWDGQFDDNDDALSLLSRGASQAGGARPKLLGTEKIGAENDTRHWLIKFNRSTDPFSYAHLEWSCLELCRRAGLDVPYAEFLSLASGRPALKIERFDVAPGGGRYHLLTFNALLKNTHNQDDALYASYESLANIIRSYSYQSQIDLKNMFGQMLINMAVRNTDDHLRNFSLMHDSIGWRLSPVYDIVPSDSLNTQHQLSCLFSDYLPMLDEATLAGVRCFHLSACDAQAVVENVRLALTEWPDILVQSGANASDREFALRAIRHVKV